MVLNTAIFVLLFLRDKLVSFSDKKVGRALMILSCALLSTQSTTGYISLCFIVLFYMLFEKKREHRTKLETENLHCFVCNAAFFNDRLYGAR